MYVLILDFQEKPAKKRAKTSRGKKGKKSSPQSEDEPAFVEDEELKSKVYSICTGANLEALTMRMVRFHSLFLLESVSTKFKHEFPSFSIHLVRDGSELKSLLSAYICLTSDLIATDSNAGPGASQGRVRHRRLLSQGHDQALRQSVRRRAATVTRIAPPQASGEASSNDIDLPSRLLRPARTGCASAAQPTGGPV